MFTLKSCPVCNSYRITVHRVIAGGDLKCEMMPGVKVDAAIITRYSSCQNCDLIFQNPRLSDTELDQFYSSGYYRRTVNQPPEGMDISEANRAKIDAKIIEKHIGKVKSHLDSGCGMGYLLNEVNAELEVGIESDVNYVKFKDIKAYREMSQLAQKSFDLVTSIHSLEHIPYPLDYLKSMVKFVNKNGHLVVEVPSLQTCGGPYGFAHLHFFKTDVLEKMCIQAGLCVQHTEYTPHLLLICKISA